MNGEDASWEIQSHSIAHWNSSSVTPQLWATVMVVAITGLVVMQLYMGYVMIQISKRGSPSHEEPGEKTLSGNEDKGASAADTGSEPAEDSV